MTSLAEGERYDHAKSQRVSYSSRVRQFGLPLISTLSNILKLSAKAANFRDSLVVSYDRVASRGARLPGALSDRKMSTPSPRPTANASTLTLASSSSFNLLTPLEQQLCSTLRILPRPYLFLKETLLREWARLGGEMGAEDARRCVAGPKDGGKATGEWGEKIERVWEFLVDLGGLRKGAARKRDEDEREYESEEGSGDGPEKEKDRGESVKPVNGTSQSHEVDREVEGENQMQVDVDTFSTVASSAPSLLPSPAPAEVTLSLAESGTLAVAPEVGLQS